MKEAMFWSPEEGKVRCGLCRFRCLIAEGQRGLCGVRENRGGVLYSLVYGLCLAEQIDPIEKKPLFHVMPGSKTFSIATAGCNFHCLHCQNADISQSPRSHREIPGRQLSPAAVVRQALAVGCESISYTYTEPTIFFEYALDIAVLAHEAGLKNIFVSNGYITPEALGTIAPYLDAANIDLKGFRERDYRELAGGTLQGVLESLKEYHRHGIWLEITTLVIPGHNDSDQEFRGIARFIREQLDPLVPWHLTAFYPTYRLLEAPPTPISRLRRAREIGLEEGLQHVYLGNIPGEEGEDTLCPGCGKAVVSRHRLRLSLAHLENGCCGYCGIAIAGVGMDWSRPGSSPE